MALNRTTIWACDVCGKQETVKSTEFDNQDPPYRWHYRNIYLSAEPEDNREWVRKVLMCPECTEGFKRLYSIKEEDKQELKKPFWQKLLGRAVL